MKQDAQHFSLAELAERAGVSARTIRFYIARGVMPGPLKAGRGAVYGAEHLTRLEEVLQLQHEGLTLSEISHRQGDGPKVGLPEPTAVLEYSLAKDVVVRVRAGVSPWRLKQINNWLAQFPAGGDVDGGAEQE